MKFRNINTNEITEAFQFYVDHMPDWFMNMVGTKKIILLKCDYRRFSIHEALCEIKDEDGDIDKCHGGDYVILDSDNNILIKDVIDFRKEYVIYDEKTDRETSLVDIKKVIYNSGITECNNRDCNKCIFKKNAIMSKDSICVLLNQIYKTK